MSLEYEPPASAPLLIYVETLYLGMRVSIFGAVSAGNHTASQNLLANLIAPEARISSH